MAVLWPGEGPSTGTGPFSAFDDPEEDDENEKERLDAVRPSRNAVFKWLGRGHAPRFAKRETDMAIKAINAHNQKRL